MADLYGFLPDLRMHCDGVPEPVAINAVRGAAIALCHRAYIWQEAINGMPVTAGVASYEFDPPTDATVFDVLSLSIGGSDIPHLPLHVNPALRSDWEAKEGQPSAYFWSGAYVQFYPVPEHDMSFNAIVALAPSRDAVTLPDMIYSRYYDTLLLGALSRLMFISAKPWTDAVSAERYDARFLMGANKALLDMRRGTAGMHIRVLPRRFI